jgi:Mrp family chromosome partitioning ATPase/capsular polysaccharide biosynthesis protein
VEDDLLADLTQESSATLRDYVRVVWLRKWLVFAIVVFFTLAAFLYSFTRPTVYQASARMMYSPPTNVDNPGSASAVDVNTLTIQLQSVGNAIGGSAVSREAADLLGDQADQPYTVTAAVVMPSGTNESSIPDSVDVTAEAGSAKLAADVANAYAQAVIEVRKASQKESLQAAMAVIQKQLDVFQSEESKLSPDYASLSLELRNLQLAEATVNGDFVVFAPATAPTSAASPEPVKTAILGFIAGLFVGIIAAFVVAQFDVRVRNSREIASIVDLNLLGRIPRLARAGSSDDELVALSDPGGSFSEAMRVIRTNLDWSNIDEQFRSLLVSSCLKGEGKTLAVCNLGVTLARAGKDVIVVDADLRNPRVHRVFNMQNTVGLTSVALGAVSLGVAVRRFEEPGDVQVRTTFKSGADVALGRWEGSLRVLTSGPLPPNPGEVVASRRVQEVLAEVSALGADYVLIDAPPLLGFGDAGALASSADGFIMVVNFKKASRPVLEEGREALESLPCRKIGLVVTGERLEDSHYAGYSAYTAR